MVDTEYTSLQANPTDASYIGPFEAILFLGECILLVLKTLLAISESVFRKCIPKIEKSVKNEVVLITGAGRGIGRELALQYASHGATVVCWGVTKDKNQKTVDEISRLGYPKAYFYPCDVSNRNLVMETAKKVQQEVGNVTILVNNAAIGYMKPVLDQTCTEIEDTINVNLLSYFWTIKAFLPTMIKNNYGHIVANCSVTGLWGVENAIPYSTTKFAIRGLMEALNKEIHLDKKCQIKITTAFPFLVKTDLIKRARVRFSRLMPILDPRYIAQEIISAQRRDIPEVSMPGYFATFLAYLRLFPVSVGRMVYDFLNVCIEE